MRGVKLSDAGPDAVVGSGLVRPGAVFWTITATGIAKCSPIEEYPTQGRAGSGVLTMKLGNIAQPDGLFMTAERDRLAAAAVGNLDDVAIVLTNKPRKFKVMKVKTAMLTQRAKGGGPVIAITGKDYVRAVVLIAPRLQAPADASLNGSASAT
jgi:DNA gyrase/topoisomerase IV subunit A